MASTVSYLKVDGVMFPPLSANQPSNNKIWSQDAGRSTTGKMQGKIICIKRKLELKWNYLTEHQIQTISRKIDSKTEWHKIEYYDVTKGELVEFTGYFGDSTYPIYGLDQQKNICVTGMAISIIER